MPQMPGYHLFSSEPGHGGAIGKRGETAPRALRIYISVDSLEDACTAAEANGGSIVEPPTVIGAEMGRFAVLRDPEGTEVGLFEASPDAPRR
jgi:predicted enzyme related to lactoylglutathione lyase